jgi:hypothetical protein
MPEYRILGKRPDGSDLRGVEIEFDTIKEAWSEYNLADGTRLRIKHNLLKAFRLVDEHDQPLFDANGDPEVFINGGVVVVASRGGSTGEK